MCRYPLAYTLGGSGTPHQPGSIDCLPDMTLGVFGDVCEQPDHSCGQALAANNSRVGKAGWIDCPDDNFDGTECTAYGGQQLGLSGPRRQLFIFQLSQLPFVELAALRVGHQTGSAARNVTQVKSHRSQPIRPRPDLCRRQALSVFRQLLNCPSERIENGRDERMDAWNWTAHPGFGEIIHLHQYR